MVRVLLPQCAMSSGASGDGAGGNLAADEADALAVAICHAHHRDLRRLEAAS